MNLVLFGFAAALAAAPADRTAVHDGKGVLRWADDAGEVAVFGVNYYTPFHDEYVETGRRGFDHKEIIRHEVAHLRRLGLNAIRLHCFDREISDRQGHLLDNHHLELLDFLVAECASNGIWTVLTPIAAWGRTSGEATNGFSFAANRRRLSSEPDLVAVQQRYEEEFVRHVNRFTGRRYADDPAVLCFELINEPSYPDGFTPEQIAGYANALLDGIRRSGTRKPVFYNAGWGGGKSLTCAPLLRTDGVTCECYCTGLRAGAALEGPQLEKVRSISLKRDDPRLAGKARLVYEFDAADTPGSYMYPAMARLFRSEGVQSATQFQYDSMPLADDNPSYKTHYLNLVYTPAKAMSLAIAAEAFRRLPRGTPFAPEKDEMSFPPFRVNAAKDVSEMATETDYLYSSTPLTPPPASERLRRVWGCGSSSVASSDGNGCYFLDRVGTGLWRLQVYPSVRTVADPYTGLPCLKTAILADSPRLTVRLPDLGTEFAVWRTTDGTRVAQAQKGAFSVPPGDYVLTREADPSADAVRRGRAADLPAYWAPPPHPVDPNWRRWPPTHEEIVAEARSRATVPERWNHLDVRRALCAGYDGRATKDMRGNLAVKYAVRNFTDRSALMVHVPVRPGLYRELFPAAGAGGTVVLTGRSCTDGPERVEFVLTFEDGQAWGLNVTLPTEWTDLRIPFGDLRYFGHWKDVPKFQAGFRPDVRKLSRINFGTGRWLNKDAVDRPHAFAVSSVTVE